MKIVVTGGLGFIGRNFALLRPENVSLHCVDWTRQATPLDHALFDACHSGCFTDAPVRRMVRGADAVVHLAADTTVQGSIRDPRRSFENNVIKTHQLLETVRQLAPEAHVVFASTGGAIIGDHTGPIHEDIAPRPKSPYGASKLAVEGLLTAYEGSYGMATTALRFSNVYGPFSAHKASVIPTFCKAILDGAPLKVFGDGRQTRDYVHASDISDALWRTLARRATGTYQLGTGVGTSIRELIELFQHFMPARQLRLERSAGLAGEVLHNMCDITRAQAALGYTPRTDLQTGLRTTLAWFEAQHVARAA